MIGTPVFTGDVSVDKFTVESVCSYKSPITADTNDKGDFHASGLCVINLLAKDKSNFKVRTLLDTGCGTNFIFSELLPQLSYEHVATTNMEIAGINKSETKQTKLVKVFIENDNCPMKYIKCYTMPNLLEYNINESAYNKIYIECKELPNVSNPLRAKVNHGEGMGMILGPGTIRDISLKPPSYYKDYLVDNTYFGPVISGRLPSSHTTASYSASLYRFNESMTEQSQFYDESEINQKLELLENLEFLASKETLGVKKEELHFDDIECLDKFKNELYYDKPNKRYIVALPFNQKKSELATNEYIAFKRMQALQRQFLSNKKYGVMYAQNIQSLLAADYIEEVKEDTPVGDVIHYLPHRGIVKEDSKTTSLRIVMDASCKRNASSLSLNDCLHTGPNLIYSMLELLLKFRNEKYGICADIEKAFLNLQIRLADRDAMRFFFPENVFDPSSRIKTYRYKVVMFGASCSPFLLAAVIQFHLESFVKDEVLKDSLKSIFIDNLITTKKTEHEAIQLYHGARKTFADMGLNIRQWASNSEKLVEIAKKDGVWDDSPKIKVLGHLWDPILDEISLKTQLKLYPNMDVKLYVLKFGNQIIDSYGLILPMEMRYRIFLTKLWENNYDWKDKFTNDSNLVKEWDTTVNNITKSLKVKIPRSIDPKLELELHLFSDASFEAYGTVAYFVAKSTTHLPDGLSQIRLAKGKVVSRKKCPKVDTIPKLELMGLVMSAHSAKILMDAYPDITFSRKVLWSDNQTALNQCSALSNKTAFVHNRVKTIRELCPGFELRYVTSFENPADLITKPVKLEKFLNSPLWWKGPSWITNSEKWDKKNPYNLHPDVKNKKTEEWSTSVNMSVIKVTTMVGMVTASVPASDKDTFMNTLWKYSNYRQMIHFFIGLNFIIKFLKNKNKQEKRVVTGNDFAQAERLAIRTMQQHSFPHELQQLREGIRPIGDKGQYAQLKLYLDSQGIIRLHGRLNDEAFLEANRPILFAYNHPLTIAYILSRHKCINCASKLYTLNKIRRDIYAPKLRKLINNLINKCIICRRLGNRAFRFPEHPPLNDYRLRCNRPFSTVGLDYIGPFVVRTTEENKKKGKNKVWIVLFSCLVSRAIYMVLVTDRRTETFLRALRELSSRHTEPKLMISDNEGSFKAADKILQQIAERPEIVSECNEKNIVWKFLPSRASWMGGVYERLVAIIKLELKKLQGKAQFSVEEWRSHLVEIEAVINDRPLTYVSDDNREPDVITPNSIVHGCASEATLATDVNIDEVIASMKMYQNQPETLYKEKIELKRKFWNSLKENYLMALRESKYKGTNSKGRYSKQTPEVGRVVAIYDTTTKLGGRLGIITELIPSADGEIRNAKVKTTIPGKVPLEKPYRTEIKIKAINHLLPLELHVEYDKYESQDEVLPNYLQEDNLSVDTSVHVSDKTDNQTESQNKSKEKIVLDDVSPNKHDNEISEENNQTPVVEEPPCAHPNCIRPGPNPERDLSWIKCLRKTCKKWHHYECVGLDYSKDYKDSIYACLECWDPQPEPKNELGIKETIINGRIQRKSAARQRDLLIKLSKNKCI